MHPAFSVIFLTTLIGAGQGLFLAVYEAQWSERLGWLGARVPREYLLASLSLAMLLTLGGLIASFFHLGRPERAWRAASRWRTSWLSREVIALPAFLGATAFYAGAVTYVESIDPLAAGAPAAAACIALFVCTGMVYASIRFLREWATPLTLINFALLGCASGFTIAATLAALVAPALVPFMALAGVVLALGGFVTRVAALMRNGALVPKSTLQTAIGVKHPRIVQIAQGFIGESFNTREFFHGAHPDTMRLIRRYFIAATFAVPVALLLLSLILPLAAVFAAIVQATGLVAERWYFLAQANHPQNVYYQSEA